MTRFPLLLWPLLLLGCATTPKMEPLEVTLSDVVPGQMSILEQEYQVKLRVQNPNNFDIALDGAAYQIELNGKAFAKGVARQSVTVPKYGDATLEGTAISDLSGVLSQISQMTKGAPEKFRYRLKGKLGRSDGSSIPFDRVGEIDLAGLGLGGN
jgi:LEA14-like dessication related protein